jgi:hypothetical protein
MTLVNQLRSNNCCQAFPGYSFWVDLNFREKIHLVVGSAFSAISLISCFGTILYNNVHYLYDHVLYFALAESIFGYWVGFFVCLRGLDEYRRRVIQRAPRMNNPARV